MARRAGRPQLFTAVCCHERAGSESPVLPRSYDNRRAEALAPLVCNAKLTDVC